MLLFTQFCTRCFGSVSETYPRIFFLNEAIQLQFYKNWFNFLLCAKIVLGIFFSLSSLAVERADSLRHMFSFHFPFYLICLKEDSKSQPSYLSEIKSISDSMIKGVRFRINFSAASIDGRSQDELVLST